MTVIRVNRLITSYLCRTSHHHYPHNLNHQLAKKTFSTQAERLAGYGDIKNINVTEVGDYVLSVELDRPKTKNALNLDIFNGLAKVFTKLNDDKHYRVAILSSTGNLFCSGIDLGTFQSMVPTHTEDVGRKALALRSAISMLQESFKCVATCQKPIISVIQGGCIGAGMELISMTDIRYASEDSYFQLKEVDLGLAADVGALQFLPLIVSNQSFLREIAYTGRKIPSSEALKVDLVGKIFPNHDETKKGALELASTIASKSPIVVQGTKIGLDYSRDHGVWEGLRFMVHWNMSMLQSEDLVKSAMALMSKAEEPPKFDDL